MADKKWYQSKLVWLGVVQTLIGAGQLVADLLKQSAITPTDITLLATGILTVILRVWFTEVPVA